MEFEKIKSWAVPGYFYNFPISSSSISNNRIVSSCLLIAIVEKTVDIVGNKIHTNIKIQN